jgi:hypothetical protein
VYWIPFTAVPHVVTVPADKRRQVVDVLTQAFGNDPAFAALWPDPTRRAS